MKKSGLNFKAFSLIEISMVILIIGILIAGVATANSLIAKSRISSAQTLTISSPINGIKDTALWLESSTDTSFSPNENSNNTALSTWYDNRGNSTTKVSITAVGSGPVYSNTINSVHAVKFDGTSSNYLTIADASFLNNTDYTIFVLEKRGASGANYLISSTASAANDKLALGYSDDLTISHSQGGVDYTSTVSGYADSSGKPKILTFVSDSTSGKKTYINGTLVSQSANTAQPSGITSLDIGKNYNGEIGEIAIFTRSLKAEERKSIEDYIGKKWTTKITRDATASCIGFTMTTDGCDLSTATCSLSATGISSSVSATSTPVTTSCNAGNYSGNVTYTCISGTPNITSNTCACSTGYTGAGCTACDTPNYVSNGSGGCVAAAGCSVSASGITTTSVAHNAAASISCNSGYTGTINYNCNNGDPGITGTCTLSSPCTGGNSITTITISGVSYKLHQFTTVGTTNLNCTTAKTVDVLIVAGGGGGGGDAAGGGGGGGVKYQTGVSAAIGNTPVTVGAGGIAGVGTNATLATNGSDSSFGAILSTGGGFGGRYNGNPGASGGSGGGGAYGSGSGASGSAGQGNAGGNAGGGAGGGGGGAGGAGGLGASQGIGGVGISNSITGSATYYGGGGGGGRQNVGAEGVNNIHATMSGGGGRGAGSCGGNYAVAGTPNTGGGGGGGPVGCQNYGAAGGSGIVIVRYPN